MSTQEEDKGQAAQQDERARDRSPPFPFIGLEKAVERAREFEAQYKRTPGRIANVLPVWGFSAKSSGGLQTIAALKAFGLLDDEGSGADRKVKLTDLAMRILKDERPGKRGEGIKEAALKPKPLAEHWQLWKDGGRPPDAECRSELTLERGYTEEAANRFLRVYDDTVAFAKLAATDSIPDESGGRPPPDQKPPGGSDLLKSFFTPPNVPQDKGVEMPERVVFAQEIDPPQMIKLLVAGPVDEAVLDALDDFVQFQRLRLKRTKAANPPKSETQPASEGGSSGSPIDL